MWYAVYRILKHSIVTRVLFYGLRKTKHKNFGEKEYVLSMDSVKENSFVIMIVKYQLDTFKYFCLEFLVLGTWSHMLPLINGRYL